MATATPAYIVSGSVRVVVQPLALVLYFTRLFCTRPLGVDHAADYSPNIKTSSIEGNNNVIVEVRGLFSTAVEWGFLRTIDVIVRLEVKVVFCSITNFGLR